MAYVSQDMKKALAPNIKAICKKYGIKASLAVRHHSSLVLNIRAGNIDFIGNSNWVDRERHLDLRPNYTPADKYISVNPYWYQDHFDGTALAFLNEIIPAMKGPNYFDESDAQIDYFHRSHYFDVNIGSWDKPYELVN